MLRRAIIGWIRLVEALRILLTPFGKEFPTWEMRFLVWDTKRQLRGRN